MVKGPVSTSKDSSIEIDGCLKWLHVVRITEIEPFFPDIQDLLPESDKPASRWGKAFGTLVGIAGLLTGSQDEGENDGDSPQGNDSEE